MFETGIKIDSSNMRVFRCGHGCFLHGCMLLPTESLELVRDGMNKWYSHLLKCLRLGSKLIRSIKAIFESQSICNLQFGFGLESSDQKYADHKS